MNLTEASFNQEYKIAEINADGELKDFLFTLGCYSGEKITVLSKLNEVYVVSIKDARYSIDKDLAEVICL